MNKEILEGNKLIAEFMGLKYGEQENWDKSKYKGWIDKDGQRCGEYHGFCPPKATFDGGNYHAKKCVEIAHQHTNSKLQELEKKLEKQKEYSKKLCTYLADTLDGVKPEVSARELKLL